MVNHNQSEQIAMAYCVLYTIRLKPSIMMQMTLYRLVNVLCILDVNEHTSKYVELSTRVQIFQSGTSELSRLILTPSPVNLS